jgi:hypothetical protein
MTLAIVETRAITGGVDTHDDVHVAAALDPIGGLLGVREFPATSAGDPAALQKICDRLGPGTIEVFAQRWLHRLPLPLSPADQRAGYWWEVSMRQVEVSRTIVFDAPRHAAASSMLSRGAGA